MMDWQWTLNQTWQWGALFIIGLVTVLSSVAIVRRISGTSTLRLGFVLMLNLSAATLMAMWVADVKGAKEGGNSITLLTQGASSQQLQQNPDAWRIGMKEGETAYSFESFEQALPYLEDIQQINVIGHGLTSEQWQLLSDKQVSYAFGESISGVTQVQWQQQLPLGSYNTITARVQENQGQSWKLSLMDPAGDEVAMAEGEGVSEVELSFAPKTVGRHVYQLRLLQGDSLISVQPVPISVDNQHLMQVSIQQSSPSFETRRLKNWLAEQGATVKSVAMLNPKMSVTDTGKLVQEVSDNEQDVMLMDGRAFAGLSETQQRAIQQRVEQGLALIVFVDADLTKMLSQGTSDLFEGIVFREDKDNRGQLKEMRWLNQPKPITADVRPYIMSPTQGSGFQGLASADGQTVFATKALKMGSVSLTTVQSSYRWMNQGESGLYSHYWQYILQSVTGNSSQLFFEPYETQALARIEQWQSFCAFDENGQPSLELSRVGNDESVTLTSARHPLRPHQYCGQFNVTQSGWYRLTASSDSGQSAYQDRFVFGDKDWSEALWSQQKLDSQGFRLGNESLNKLQMMQRLDAINYWTILILIFGVLWLERRLFDAND